MTAAAIPDVYLEAVETAEDAQAEAWLARMGSL